MCGRNASKRLQKRFKKTHIFQEIANFPKMPKSKESSIASIKKKLRDTQRTLKRPSLNASLKTNLERRVRALELELKSASEQSASEKLQSKYKYVKFVERKKIERKLAQSQKELALDSQNQELQNHIADLELQRAYIDHYPMDLKYISLLKKDGMSQEALEKQSGILSFLEQTRTSDGTFQINGSLRSSQIFASFGNQTEHQTVNERSQSSESVEDDFFLS